MSAASMRQHLFTWFVLVGRSRGFPLLAADQAIGAELGPSFNLYYDLAIRESE